SASPAFISSSAYERDDRDFPDSRPSPEIRPAHLGPVCEWRAEHHARPRRPDVLRRRHVPRPGGASDLWARDPQADESRRGGLDPARYSGLGVHRLCHLVSITLSAFSWYSAVGRWADHPAKPRLGIGSPSHG